MKDTNLNVNEYLPLRDVVFNTLRQAIITGESHRANASWKSLLPIVLA